MSVAGRAEDCPGATESDPGHNWYQPDDPPCIGSSRTCFSCWRREFFHPLGIGWREMTEEITESTEPTS